MDPKARTKQIGRQIRAARLAKGLSQTQLAELIPCTKVNVGYISRWETGRHRPSQANLETLARVLDVPVAFLYGNDG